MTTITYKQTIISENLNDNIVTLSYEYFKDGELYRKSEPKTFEIGKVTSYKAFTPDLEIKIFRKKFIKLKDGSYGSVAVV